MRREVYLKQVEWPDFGKPLNPMVPEPPLEEMEARLQRCRAMMAERRLTHLVVYADREHSANLMYLAYFDPRFEEALLILKQEGDPLLLVGNECVSHLTMSPLYNHDKLRYERYQPFSLLSQPRDDSRGLSGIFREEGIAEGASVGCAGWKYFTEEEFLVPEKVMEIPSFLVETLRSLCGADHVVNASDIFMSPAFGLRTRCSVHDIAFFEFSNVMASEGMKNVLKNFRYGITDFEMIREYGFTGYPLSCHMGLKSSGNMHIGLSSPVGAVIEKGAPCSTNIGYWGSNLCRAGWVARSEEDLPEQARGYIEHFAAPYFAVCGMWYEQLRIGTPGKVIRELIDRELPFEDFAIFLNPGHLIHYDEWVSSPVYRNSEDEIRSGMYMQVDIIPRSEKYYSTRMEEGIIIADKALRQQLEETYPDVYYRCMQRRSFMTGVLGFVLPEEILPLSNMPGLVSPFFLDYRNVFSFKP